MAWRDPEDPRWERHAAATGIVFVVLAAIAFLLAPDPPKAHASIEEVSRWYFENDSRVLWQTFLFGLAGIFFIWFYATVANRLRRAENRPVGRLPAVIVVAAGAAAGLFWLAFAAFAALASNPVLINLVLFELGSMAVTLTNFPAIALVAAISLGALRTRFLPDWVAWTGAIAILIGLVDVGGRTLADSDEFGPGAVFGTLAFAVFLLWTLAVSVQLWRTSPRASGLDRVHVTGEDEARPQH